MSKSEVWVIYDRANDSYLTGGNWRALEYGRAVDPLEAHHYVRENIAIKMLKRLRGDIEKASKETERHLLPIWRRNDSADTYYDPVVFAHRVTVQPDICIRRIYSPQIEEVDL